MKTLRNVSMILVSTMIFFSCETSKTKQKLKLGNYSGSFSFELKYKKDYEAKLHSSNSVVYDNDRQIECNIIFKNGVLTSDSTIYFSGYDDSDNLIGNCSLRIIDSNHIYLSFDENYSLTSPCNELIDFDRGEYLEFKK